MVLGGIRSEGGIVTTRTKCGNQYIRLEPVKHTQQKEPSDSGRQSHSRSIHPVCVIPLELSVSIIGRASSVLSLICSMHMQRKRSYALILRLQSRSSKSAVFYLWALPLKSHCCYDATGIRYRPGIPTVTHPYSFSRNVHDTS